MAFVETERRGQIMVIRMNRPERLNALGHDLRTGLAEAWCEFRDSDQLEVAVFTGTGRAFCAGEDMKESVERGAPGRGQQTIPDPFRDGTLPKPVIAAINGYGVGRSSRSPRLSGGYSAATITVFWRDSRIPLPPRWPWDFASRPSACIRWDSSIASWNLTNSCPQPLTWPSTC
jgi:Enoyl-CoA hydratase/isomerase